MNTIPMPPIAVGAFMSITKQNKQQKSIVYILLIIVNCEYFSIPNMNSEPNSQHTAMTIWLCCACNYSEKILAR